ncbi:MAG: hypothetical protein ACXAB5_05810, partial [Candidatus Thorarchaeota archaeon]
KGRDLVKKKSWSVKTNPDPDDDDLSLLAGRWNAGVQVRITHPVRIKPGPIRVENLREKKESHTDD